MSVKLQGDEVTKLLLTLGISERYISMGLIKLKILSALLSRKMN